jgi:hypothetical protein
VEYRIEFGGEPQDVTVTTSGQADLTTFERMNEELTADGRFHPGMKILVDHSDLDVSPLMDDEIRGIADSVTRAGELFRDASIAIVAPKTVTFGVARQSVSLATVAGLRVGVFGVRANALEWLRGSGAGES